jgi:hypothetical protein
VKCGRTTVSTVRGDQCPDRAESRAKSGQDRRICSICRIAGYQLTPYQSDAYGMPYTSITIPPYHGVTLWLDVGGRSRVLGIGYMIILSLTLSVKVPIHTN